MSLAYCLSTDVESILSEVGLDARVDDAPSDISVVIDDASSQIDEFLLPVYDAADLAGNRWVNHCCADMASFLLCERRGDPVPASIQAKWDRRMISLERFRLGQAQVPELARKRLSVPKMSNVRVKMGPNIRTVVSRHRGGPQRTPPTDYVQTRDPAEMPNDYQN